MTEFKRIDEIIEPYRIKKPWYWPVTTTIYKLGLCFFMTIGAGHFAVFIIPEPLKWSFVGGFSALIGAFYYLSLKYRDWL